MRNVAGRMGLAMAMSLALAGCIPVDGPTGAVLLAEAPVASPVADTVYVSRQDGAFNIPALPVEQIPAEFRRQSVEFASDQPPGTIIVNPAAKHLLFVTGPNEAIRYGIAVGRAGFEWSGEAVVTNRKTWPTWTPPPEMIARKPDLAKWAAGQPGGPENPLGARALYLTTNGIDYGYRIHGTPEWQSIGSSASSGCIRMINQDVIDLFSRVPDGAKVIVMTRDGQMPNGLSLPPQAPKKAASKPKPQPKPEAPAVFPFGEPDLPDVPVPPAVVI